MAKGVQEAEIKAALAKNGYTEETIKSVIAEKSSNKEKSETIAKNNGLKGSFKGLASTIGMSTTALGLLTTGLTALVAIGVSAWQNYKQSIEDAVSSASEEASTYSEQTSSIDEMVSKYQELREQLIAAKGNEEETYNIKQQLLELQTQLNEQFGDEYGKLNLVTDAYKDQTEAIKAYNKEASQKYLNENRKGIEEATKQMEKDNTYYLGSMNGMVDASELKYLDEIKSIASDNNIEFTDNGFEFIGNAEDASDSINAFMNQIKDLQKDAGDTSSVLSGIFDGILDNSGEALVDADSIIEKYNEIYEQAKLAEIASDDKLSSGYSDLVNAVSEYNDAVSNSDDPYNDENVQKAYDNLQTVKKGIDDNSAEWGKYSDIVEEAYNQADTSAYSFYGSIKDNMDGVGDLTNELKGLSNVDLQAMVDDGDNGDAFDKLCAKAEEYGLEVQDVIDLLVELGIVQGEIADSSDQTEPSISYDTLSDSAESATDAVDTLRSAISSVNDAFAEQAENGSISVDTMLALVDAGYATALQFDATTGACTINKEAMLDLVQAKIQNQIADLQTLQTNIATKLKDDGLIASESAEGFIKLAKSKAAAATAEQLASVSDYNDAEAQIKALENAMKNLDKIGTGSYSTKSASGSSKKSSSSSSSKDAWKEEFEAQYDLLKHNLEMEYITEEQYYSALNALNEKYFANNAKYTDEYRKYQEEVYKGMQQVYKDYIENNMSYLEKALDANKISFGHYSNAVKKMLDDMWHEGKISAEEYWSYVQKMLEKQLDIYDATLSAVTDLLDDEIDKLQDEVDALNDKNDALNDQLEIYDSALSAIEKVYDDEIQKLEDQKQAIQDVIDAMQEENDERERAMALQQAQYNLNRALSQNANYIYKDGQFVYTTDQTAIREAQDSLHEAQYNIDIAELQKQQDALDDYIDVLNSYKNLWSEIAEAYQTAQDSINATAILGANYAQLVLNNNLSDIENFKNQYVEIQSQINSNDELIASIEEKINYYENLKEQWSSVADVYEKEQNRIYASQVLGADWEAQVLSGRIDTLNNFKNQYVALQQAIADAAVASANAIVQANQNAANSAMTASASISSGSGSSSGGGSSSSASEIWYVKGSSTGKIYYSGDKASAKKVATSDPYTLTRVDNTNHIYYVGVKSSSSSSSKGGSSRSTVSAYASGTTNAKKGLNLVGEDGTETYIDNDGNISLVTEPSLINMEGGETVKNAKETEELLNPNNFVPIETMELPGLNGTILKLSSDEFRERITKAMPSYSSMVQSAIQTPRYDAVPVNRNNNATITQQVTFNCPNLTDKSGIEYVERELQSLATRAMQFDWSK